MTRRAARWACGVAIMLAAIRPGAASPPQTYAAGREYSGRGGLVEFHAGELPFIISAPHGGALEPAEIPNRASGTTVTDSATADLAREFAAALRARTGRDPWLVICRLKRTKLDVNREVAEGAQGNPQAIQAWTEYHAFIDAARAAAAGRHGRALVVDLHGHGHPKARVEIGYLIGAADLGRPDVELDDPAFARQSSIRTLAAERGLPFSALLRGSASLGGLLEQAGYSTVPGPATPHPGTDPYFEGGYITRRHGSADGGPVSAIQIEAPYAGFRDTQPARERFAAALAEALVTYVPALFPDGRPPPFGGGSRRSPVSVRPDAWLAPSIR